MKRDVLMTIPWLIWKGVYLFVTAMYFGGLYCWVTHQFDPGTGFVLFPATAMYLFLVWMDVQTTSIPALFWRHRKNFTLRVIDTASDNKRAIQIKLFGLWWYLELDPNHRQPPEIKLFNVHGISIEYNFQKYMDQRDAERLADRIVKLHIRPPEVTFNVSEDLQYGNYNRIDRSDR